MAAPCEPQFRVVRPYGVGAGVPTILGKTVEACFASCPALSASL